MNNDNSTTAIAFSRKADGSMKKKDGTIDFDNLEKFLSSKGLSSKYVSMEQVHGGNIAVISDHDGKFVGKVDGLITDKPGINLCIITADCLPILFHDDKKKIIGAAHAGSKGLLSNIVHNLVTEFKDIYGSNPSDIKVRIGPSIEQNCYEVGKELIEMFASQHSWFNETFYTEAKKVQNFLDLRKIALHCLQKEGILKENIRISDQCTKCSTDTLYSYRRGDKTGRFVSAISLL